MRIDGDLDTSQLHFFRTFGYVVLRGLFAASELDLIDREHRDGLALAFPDEPFAGELGQWTRMMNESTPFFAALPEDPRFHKPARQLCGDDVLGNGSDAHYAVGDTDWHTDSGWQPDAVDVQMGVKYHFHLDSVDADSGALRFIPGSHLLRGVVRKEFGKDILELPTAEVPCQVVDTEPGDVILFDIRAWHASVGGRPGRRTANAEFFGNPRSREGIDLLREIARLQANSRNAKEYTYPANWLANPHHSETRQRWIDRFMEMDFFAQPGVGEV